MFLLRVTLFRISNEFARLDLGKSWPYRESQRAFPVLQSVSSVFLGSRSSLTCNSGPFNNALLVVVQREKMPPSHKSTLAPIRHPRHPPHHPK